MGERDSGRPRVHPTTSKCLEGRSKGDSKKVSREAESETERKQRACECESVRASVLLRPPGLGGWGNKKDGAEGSRGRCARLWARRDSLHACSLGAPPPDQPAVPGRV